MKKNIIQLLLAIKENPVMYIGENNIFYLKNYIMGYCVGSNDEKNLEIINKFQIWIQQKYHIEDCISWARIIKNIAAEDNMDSIILFFSLFEEFLEES